MPEGFPRNWRDVVLAGMVIAGFVAISFAPTSMISCSTSSDNDESTPTGTTEQSE